MITKHPETGTVEFVLEMDTAETPHLMGSWDGWATGIAMVRDADGARAWRMALKLPPGDHQFRYRVGERWFNDATADRYVGNGYGGENAVIVVGKTVRIAGLLAAPKKAVPVRAGKGRGQRRGVERRELQH